MDKQTCKLHHIALSVPDVAAAQRFFEEPFDITASGWKGAVKNVTAAD